MKHLSAFILLTILLQACTFTKQQKAEKLVKEYLKEKLNDPDSYSPVKFDHFDTLYSHFFTDKEYRKKDDSLTSIESDLKMHSYDFSKSQLLKMKADKKRLEIETEKMAKEFKKEAIGWSIWHTYRAKNGFGALRLDSSMFLLNKELTGVTGIL